MAAPRRALRKRVIFRNKNAINLVATDGLLPDDLLIQGMKAEGYRVMTGRDVFPSYGRKIRDYLIRLKTVTS
jgi:hypothetical protein